MTDKSTSNDGHMTKKTGDGVGGADASGAGNILGAVQPKDDQDEEGEERRDR